MPGAYGSNAGPEQFRVALFPDRVNFTGVSYYPAEGYITRARKFVAGVPDSLSSLTEQEITYLFGKPGMQRRDASAKIWQYKTKACVVDIYFYEEPGAEGQSRVSYVDYRLRGMGQRELSDADVQGKCLGRMADADGIRI
jgi:hypothetical protein